MNKYFFNLCALLICTLLFTACTSIPKNLTVVENFSVEKFLGTWYEIARLDHKVERNLEQVTATYSGRKNGGITVLNKGFDSSKQVWKSVEGKAFLNGTENQGRLKVSFFGPFYGGYNILKLEDDYSIAMIAGPNRKYLWILAREKTIDKEQLNTYIQSAKTWGFDTEQLIMVKQNYD